MKESATWHSNRVGCQVTMVRWGHFGLPVLIFPTAGGDAEEIERFHVISVLQELIDAGRIKVYSCDSIAGRALATGEGSLRHRAWIQNQFQEFVFHEVVPAIRMDCHAPDIEIVAAGASIGAFTSLAVLCRYPQVFSKCLCMSGTFDLRRFYKGDGELGHDFFISSPVHYVPHLDAERLAPIRKRFVLFATGEGRAEDVGESWRAAKILGDAGIPNRVDSWGQDWHHDWPTWRNMLPKYLGEMS
jgi:esterase/lipase superfamily enzyme